MPITWVNNLVHSFDGGTYPTPANPAQIQQSSAPYYQYQTDGAKWANDRFYEQYGDDRYKTAILPSRLILLAILTLIGLQEMAGASVPFGFSATKLSPDPYAGDCFNQGSQDFTKVAELLKTAVPPSWQGAGADAYTTANDKLIELAETMAQLDTAMAGRVNEHAAIVRKTQLGIGVEQDILLVAYPFIVCLEKSPTTLPAAWNTARAVALAAIVTALSLLGWCLGTSVQTGKAMDGLGYGDVLAEASALIGAPPSVTVSVPQSGGSVAPDFAQLSGGASGSSAISGAPPVASPPGAASPLDDAPGEGQRLGIDSPQAVVTPDRAAPFAPAPPMPGVAQMSQPSGQAANRSGGVASPGNRINPQAGQLAPEGAVDGGGQDTGTAAALSEPGVKVPAAYAALGRSEQAPVPTPAA